MYHWMREERFSCNSSRAVASVVVVHGGLLQNSGDGMIVLI